MLTNRIRVWAAVAFAIVAVVILWNTPDAYRNMRAKSFTQFAQGGVTVKTVGTIIGTGDPILVQTGIGLMWGNMFELTNERGETRRIVVCNGHPDYGVLSEAEPSTKDIRTGFKVLAKMSQPGLEDEHTTYGAWWVGHLGFERNLRFLPAPHPSGVRNQQEMRGKS